MSARELDSFLQWLSMSYPAQFNKVERIISQQQELAGLGFLDSVTDLFSQVGNSVPGLVDSYNKYRQNKTAAKVALTQAKADLEASKAAARMTPSAPPRPTPTIKQPPPTRMTATPMRAPGGTMGGGMNKYLLPGLGIAALLGAFVFMRGRR